VTPRGGSREERERKSLFPENGPHDPWARKKEISRKFPNVSVRSTSLLSADPLGSGAPGPAIGIVFAQDVQVRIQKDWVRDP